MRSWKKRVNSLRKSTEGRFEVVCAAAAALMMVGFLILAVGAASVSWTIIGVLLMDFGAGLSHSANQSAAFALRPDARGRINSVYMSGYFLGGALGASLATLAYAAGRWDLACAFGAACAGVMLVAEFLRVLRARARPSGDARQADQV